MGNCCGTSSSSRQVVKGNTIPKEHTKIVQTNNINKNNQISNNNNQQINNNSNQAEDYEKRRKLMAEQYENKLEKDRQRGISNKSKIEMKLKEEKLKKVEEYEKSNPRDERQFQYK